MIFNKDNLTRFGLSIGRFKDGNLLEEASKIGNVFHPKGMPSIQSLIPKPVEIASSNTYSGNYGYADFPYNTDLPHWHIPPRYLLLICETPDISVLTKVINWNKILEQLDQDVIKRARFIPRKPLNNRIHRLKISDGELNRWDPLFITPVNQSGLMISEFLKNFDFDSHAEQINLSERGEFILLDNWKTLHARSPVPQSSKRLIHRIFLSKLHN